MISWPSTEELPQSLEGSTLQDWMPARSVFEALQMSAASHGERIALTFLPQGIPEETPRQVSYNELAQQVARVANLLRKLGVGAADTVAYMLPALPETHFLLWGAETAGIAMPINPLLRVEDIAALLNAANVKVLVALGPMSGSDIWSKARAARALAPAVHTLMRLGGSEDGDADVDFSSSLADAASTLAFSPPELGDVAAYFHTGGTTGAPKLAVHSHRNQLAAAFGGALAIGADVSDVMLNGLPMFHVAATIFGSLSMFLAGARVIVPSPAGYRNPTVVSNFWRIAETQGATLLGGVPTAFAAALTHDPQGIDLSTVRASVCGAALTPPAVSAGIERVTGKPLREVYGMTECGGVICVDPVWIPRVQGSAGLPIPFCTVQARRLERGQPGPTPCAPGEPGVLVVRGPQVTSGYLQPEQNASLFTRDGWLVTGDLGYVQSDGRVFITGRFKDLIIRGGHNIDPAVIENCLRAHPAVADAAAVGMPDAYAGEVPVAYVVLKPGQSATEEALREFAAVHVAERPALPRWVQILDALPLTAVGKPYKPELRESAARRLFEEVLRDLPVEGLQVHDEGPRGMKLTLSVKAAAGGPATDAEHLRAAVAERLQSYSLRFQLSSSSPDGWVGSAEGRGPVALTSSDPTCRPG